MWSETTLEVEPTKVCWFRERSLSPLLDARQPQNGPEQLVRQVVDRGGACVLHVPSAVGSSKLGVGSRCGGGTARQEGGQERTLRSGGEGEGGR